MPLTREQTRSKYFQLYTNSKRLAWDPAAVDLSRDAADWEMIRRDYPTEEFAKQLHQLCAFFHAGEESVTSTLAPLLGAVARLELGVDIEMYLTSQIYEGMKADYWIYASPGVDASKPAPLMVWQDGQGMINRNAGMRLFTVTENLIAQKLMPPVVYVLIAPGFTPGDKPLRAIEYDTVTDRYTRFLMEEVLPQVEKLHKLRTDGYSRAIGGSSSGAICAFNTAWFKPESFARVHSTIGSYTSIQWHPEDKLEGGNVYPHKFHVDYRLPDFCDEFQPKTTEGERITETNVSIAGRIVSLRGQGKLFFYDIRGDGVKVQIMSDLKTYAAGDDAFYKIHRTIKRGDIVGINGFPGKSKTGELSIFPTQITLLSPCLHMLPFPKGDTGVGGITNQETRYRQ